MGRLAVEVLVEIATTATIDVGRARELAARARATAAELLGAGDVAAGARLVRLAAGVDAADLEHLVHRTAELAEQLAPASTPATASRASS